MYSILSLLYSNLSLTQSPRNQSQGHSRSSEPTRIDPPYDFQLTFHSKHLVPFARYTVISVDNFKFPPPVCCAPTLTGFALGLGIGARSRKSKMMGLPGGQNSFKIDLAVSTQYCRVTDRLTDTARRQRPRYAERRAVMICTS